MQLTITVTVNPREVDRNDLARLRAVIDLLDTPSRLTENMKPEPESKPEPKPEPESKPKRRRGRPRKSKPKPAPEPEPEPAPEPEDGTEDKDVADPVKLFKAFVDKHGAKQFRDVLRAAAGRMDVTRVKDLTEDQINEAAAEIKQRMAE